MEKAHGISLGVERIGDKVYLAGKASGKLTHDDYQVVTPFLESVFANLEQGTIRMFFDIRAFDGWEVCAAWDDFRIGLKHGHSFERIALLGTAPAQDLISKLTNWFMSGEVRFFDNENDALAWLLD